MPEMSGKCKSNPTKSNNLIFIMIFLKQILGGGKKNLPPPLIYAPAFFPYFQYFQTFFKQKEQTATLRRIWEFKFNKLHHTNFRENEFISAKNHTKYEAPSLPPPHPPRLPFYLTLMPA